MASANTPHGAPDAAPLVVVGCGFVGRALIAEAKRRGRTRVTVTTRDSARCEALAKLGVSVVPLDQPGAWDQVNEAALGGDCVVTFPPEPSADATAAAVVRRARAGVYISSTAVYGGREGTIDDRTEAPGGDERGQRRLVAEARYREVGATVLRAPGIYGPGRGVHRRLLNGTFRLVGDGGRHISRIHVDDLVGCTLAALARDAADGGQGERRGSVHVVGDLRATPQRELVAFLCERLGLPMPGSVPVEAAHATLRGNRQVDPRLALTALGYRLRHPDYVSGYGQVLAADAPESFR